MKWKHNIKYWLTGLVLTLVAGFLAYFAYALYSENLYFDSVNTVVTFAIGLVSFLLSIVALIFSVVTYVSIDSVNVLSSMEGNVLCNENYNAEYVALVDQYNDCDTQLSLQKKLFADIEKELKLHSKTCMAFTDTLQNIIDRLLWFAYVDTKRGDYQKSVADLIEKIEKKYREFNAISNGNQYVLREHIKLIKNVLNYQSVQHEGRELDAAGEMLNIRGRMLMNSVSKTIYHDYLGLEFHKKALEIIRRLTGYEGEEYLSRGIESISQYKYSPFHKDEINMYLSEAQSCFDKAMATSTDDILWRGYISFNKARVEILSSIVNNSILEDAPSWIKTMQDSIGARFTVRKIFGNEDDRKLSFLELEFAKEHFYAEAVYLSVAVYRDRDGEHAAENNRNANLIKDAIIEINKNNEIIFNRTIKYLDEVIEHTSTFLK